MSMKGDEAKGLIFNIQRFSVHDGPGIRTLIFMKGCPLRCLWCCNPEGQNPCPEIAYYEKLCASCYRCVAECPNQAIRIREDRFPETLSEKCDNCGECAEVCPHHARKVFGRYYAVDEILDIARRDASFYRRSRGGITVGGGEPLAQPAFVRELLETAKREYGLHTAVETSGYAKPHIVTSVLRHVDFILYDIKHVDPRKHQELTGVSNQLILNNLRLIVDKIASKGKELVIRITIVPKLNDQTSNLLGVASLVKSLGEDVRVELLPYHEFGMPKYRALGREYPLEGRGIGPPSKGHMDRLREILTEESIDVVKT